MPGLAIRNCILLETLIEKQCQIEIEDIQFEGTELILSSIAPYSTKHRRPLITVGWAFGYTVSNADGPCFIRLFLMKHI